MPVPFVAKNGVLELDAYLELRQLASVLAYGRLYGMRSRLHYCATSIMRLSLSTCLQLARLQSLYVGTR